VRRVLVTLGGADVHGLAPQLVRVIDHALKDVAVDVVVGPFFANRDALADAARASRARVALHDGGMDRAALMRGADVAVSGGGQTLYELAAVGTPVVAIQLAENQAWSLSHLAAIGTLVVAGAAAEPAMLDTVAGQLAALAGNPLRRKEMSACGLALVDGKGAERVAVAILGLCAEPRASRA
jgi:spore coat polysaccharide biosynthesis predicted glycosyltransferase SpsG